MQTNSFFQISWMTSITAPHTVIESHGPATLIVLNQNRRNRSHIWGDFTWSPVKNIMWASPDAGARLCIDSSIEKNDGEGGWGGLMGGGGWGGWMWVKKSVDGGGGRSGGLYTKLSHPYSSHANGKTTQWLFLESNGANWKRKRGTNSMLFPRGAALRRCQIISPLPSPPLLPHRSPVYTHLTPSHPWQHPPAPPLRMKIPASPLLWWQTFSPLTKVNRC